MGRKGQVDPCFGVNHTASRQSFGLRGGLSPHHGMLCRPSLPPEFREKLERRTNQLESTD